MSFISSSHGYRHHICVNQWIYGWLILHFPMSSWSHIMVSFIIDVCIMRINFWLLLLFYMSFILSYHGLLHHICVNHRDILLVTSAVWICHAFSHIVVSFITFVYRRGLPLERPGEHPSHFSSTKSSSSHCRHKLKCQPMTETFVKKWKPTQTAVSDFSRGTHHMLVQFANIMRIWYEFAWIWHPE